MTVPSLFRLIFVGAHTVAVAPVIVAVALLDQHAAYRLCQLWVRVNLLACGVHVHTRRQGVLDPNASYVFMSNHKSQFDILAVVMALHEFQLRWVAKKELTRVPVFGWVLRNTGHIIIDRSDHEQAVASLRTAREKVREGVSVMIFPEGTRARAGDPLLPFKKGGFMLALETGLPIVPIAVRGSAAVLPSHSLWIKPGEIDVVVGPPIPVAGRDRDEVMQRVRAFMLHEVSQPMPARAASPVAAEAS